MWKTPRHRSAPGSLCHCLWRQFHAQIRDLLVVLMPVLGLFRRRRNCQSAFFLRGATRSRYRRRGATRWRSSFFRRGATRSRSVLAKDLSPRLNTCSRLPRDASHGQHQLRVVPAVLVEPPHGSGPDDSNTRAKDVLVVVQRPAQVDAVPPVLRELVLLWSWLFPHYRFSERHELLCVHPAVVSLVRGFIVARIHSEPVSDP